MACAMQRAKILTSSISLVCCATTTHPSLPLRHIAGSLLSWRHTPDAPIRCVSRLAGNGSQPRLAGAGDQRLLTDNRQIRLLPGVDASGGAAHIGEPSR